VSPVRPSRGILRHGRTFGNDSHFHPGERGIPWGVCTQRGPRGGARVTELLAAEHVASLVAPVVDRLRLAIHRATQGWAAGMARERDLDQSMSMVIGNLRNLAPGRVVSRSAVLSVFAYQPSTVVDGGIDALIRTGLLTDVGEGHICLSDSGVGLAAEIHARGDEVAGELWSEQDERVAALAELAARALRAATADGGDAFAVMAPLAEPAQATDAALLAERLTGLRFHRFDAHIAAWRSAGLTVDGWAGRPARLNACNARLWRGSECPPSFAAASRRFQRAGDGSNLVDHDECGVGDVAGDGFGDDGGVGYRDVVADQLNVVGGYCGRPLHAFLPRERRSRSCHSLVSQ
jgi:hypothetical protein